MTITYNRFNKRSFILSGECDRYRKELRQIGARHRDYVSGKQWTLPVGKQELLDQLIQSITHTTEQNGETKDTKSETKDNPPDVTVRSEATHQNEIETTKIHQLEKLESRARPRKEQHKYQRAVSSDDEEHESDDELVNYYRKFASTPSHSDNDSIDGESSDSEADTYPLDYQSSS